MSTREKGWLYTGITLVVLGLPLVAVHALVSAMLCAVGAVIAWARYLVTDEES